MYVLSLKRFLNIFHRIYNIFNVSSNPVTGALSQRVGYIKRIINITQFGWKCKQLSTSSLLYMCISMSISGSHKQKKKTIR